MLKIRLAVIHNDKPYGQALGKAIAMSHWDFQVTVSPADLCSEEYDLILTDENNNILSELQSAKMIVLCEEPGAAAEAKKMRLEKPGGYGSTWSEANAQGPAVIYKYERISTIVKKLRYHYSCLSGRRAPFLTRDIQPMVLGVASGGVGDSEAAAVAVARELATREEQVLYLSFEEFPLSAPWFQEDDGCRPIEEYLYYLLSGDREHMVTQLSLFTFSDIFGVRTFRAAEGRNQLRILNHEELERFLAAVVAYLPVSYIVLNLSSSLFDNFSCLVDWCHRLLLLGKRNHPSRWKSQKLLSHLEREMVESPVEKVCWMENLCAEISRDEAAEAEGCEDSEDGRVQMNWNGSQSYDMWFQHEFMLEVKKFVRDTKESLQCSLQGVG